MTADLAEPDLVETLALQARRFAADLAGQPGTRRVAIPDFRARALADGTLFKPVVWENDVFVGPDFRWAHVEFFSIPEQIGVIHVCVFPHLDRQAPIFGFDIIAGCRKATGAFLDLSPTTTGADDIIEAWAARTSHDKAAFEDHRHLPDWAAAIFSPHALAIRPASAGEVDAVLTLGRTSLGMMLGSAAATGPASRMIAAQNRYGEGQRSNEHTFRMLAGCVGPAIAREFIDGWLFPSVQPPVTDQRAR